VSDVELLVRNLGKHNRQRNSSMVTLFDSSGNLILLPEAAEQQAE
jgi:hypothetical protein